MHFTFAPLLIVMTLPMWLVLLLFSLAWRASHAHRIADILGVLAISRGFGAAAGVYPAAFAWALAVALAAVADRLSAIMD